MEKCRDVMTKNPICCMRDDSVIVAAKLMNVKDIGSIPVVENELTRKLVGIVTDRDLALEVVAEGYDPKNVKVGDVMTRELITCHPEDDLYMALDAMSKYQLRRIPVVDDDNRIAGIIAQADIATRTNWPEKTAEMVREISQ